jgi:hypothetical protein
MSNTAARTMLDNALCYLAQGLPILPLCTPAWGQHMHPKKSADGKWHDEPCKRKDWGKIPLVAWKKFQTGLPTPDEVRGWWTRWPDANIGMATGQLSGVVVLDVEGPEAREAALARGGLDKTRLAWTGKPGGSHLYIEHPGHPVHNFARELPGTDFRGDGGYVVLPPSLHERGAHYRWDKNPQALAPLPMPAWLKELTNGSSGSVAAADHEPLDLARILNGLPEGERDDTLFRYACKMRRDGVPQRYAELQVRLAARACRPPFDEAIAAEKVHRAYQTYPVGDGQVVRGEVRDHDRDHDGPRLQAMGADELFPLERRPIPWLIDDLLAEREVCILGARHGTGKSFSVMELIVSLTTGRPFLGHFTVPRPCRVLWVDEESSPWLLSDRFPRLLLAHGIDRDTYLREIAPSLMVFNDQQFSFDNDEKLAELTDRAAAFQPDVGIFDTLIRVHRRSENDNSAMAGLFDDKVKPFIRAVGCSVIFPHHTRKPGRDAPDDAASMLRGASDIAAFADEFWFLRSFGPGRVLFEHSKCRPAAPQPSVTLVLEDTDSGGVQLRYEGEGGPAAELSQLQRGQEAILYHLVANGPSTRRVALGAARAAGVGERTAATALGALVADGQVVKTGSGKQVRYHAVEAIDK